MGLRRGLAATVLIAGLASPGVVAAQVAPPPATITEDVAPDLLAHLWCRQVFAHESARRNAEGDAARSDHYALLTVGMESEVADRFIGAGHSEARRDIIISFYRITLQSVSRDRPEEYRDALGACETAFSSREAPSGPLPSLVDGIAAYEAGDHETAFAILHPHAVAGDMEAQYHLGLIYVARFNENRGNEHLEPLEYWLLLAARQGHEAAATVLSIRFSGLDGAIVPGACIYDHEAGTMVALAYTMSESMIAGQSLKEQDWRFEPVEIDGRTFTRYGLSRVLGWREIEYLGSRGEVPFFAEIGRRNDFDIVYALDDPHQCGFQPYSLPF